MTKVQVAQLIGIRYQFGDYFCQLLERLLAKTPEGPIKKTLQMNLAEELGLSSLYPGPAHTVGRRRLLEALGVDYDSWKPQGDLGHLDPKLHPAARKVISEFVQLIDHPNFLVGVAAIAASESAVPKQYKHLVSLLKKHWPELADQDMLHLLDHIEHDMHHGGDLENLLSKEPDQAAVELGKKSAQTAWQEFWKSVGTTV